MAEERNGNRDFLFADFTQHMIHLGDLTESFLEARPQMSPAPGLHVTFLM